MKRSIAIVGLGAAARQIHLPAYAKLPDLEIVGGCDPVANSREFPFPIFSSAEKMLDATKPDILAVVTPPASHYELARLGLLAGCHVFCEKPFVSDLAEAAHLVDLSRQLNRWVVVNNQFRFMNIFRESRKLIGSEEFGELLFLSAHQTFFITEQTEAGWRGQERMRTCKEFGIHVLDLCRFFFGEDPVAIFARMPRGTNQEGPDYLNLIQLEFSGDRVAQITLDRVCRGPHRYLMLRLDGTVGCLEIEIGGNLALSMGIRGGARKPFFHWDLSMGGQARLYHGERFKKIASDPLGIFAHATKLLMAAFLDALNNGKVPPCHADDNRRTLALMLAAYASAEKRRTLDVVID
jgi:predicted dehydrogenase